MERLGQPSGPHNDMIDIYAGVSILQISPASSPVDILLVQLEQVLTNLCCVSI